MGFRVYVDASVIGGCEDVEFSEHSMRLFDRFEDGTFTLVLSTLTLQELARAPESVRRHLDRVSTSHVEILQLSEAARTLASSNIDEGIVSPRMLADAQHIAIATMGQVDVLVSWNFKHIVNLSRIKRFNSVNRRLGFADIEIRAPQEVLPDE